MGVIGIGIMGGYVLDMVLMMDRLILMLIKKG